MPIYMLRFASVIQTLLKMELLFSPTKRPARISEASVKDSITVCASGAIVKASIAQASIIPSEKDHKGFSRIDVQRSVAYTY